MENNIPLVSIIIPCRNEEKIIGKCLDSILAQEYPKEKLEVLIVDGMSTDKTREIVKEYTEKYDFIRLINNAKLTAPAGMNNGIEEAKGQAIIIMGAHAIYTKDYVSKCIMYIDQYNADAVGGLMQTLPGAETLKAKAIALALSSPFGVGNSYFRIGIKEPRFVDTVPFGCYRREVFDRIGLFDEELVRNQDAEFNHRLTKNGGKILLVPSIVSYYYARDSYKKLLKMHLQYGYFRVLTAKKVGVIVGFRQIVPALFIVSLILWLFFIPFLGIFFGLFIFEIFLYLISNLVFSLVLAVKKKNLLLMPFLIFAFSLVHFTYGFAYLRGIFDFFILRKNKVDHSRISLTR